MDKVFETADDGLTMMLNDGLVVGPVTTLIYPAYDLTGYGSMIMMSHDTRHDRLMKVLFWRLL